MNWPVLCVVAFLAINGMIYYFPQSHTYRLKRSRFLQFYGIWHNLWTVLGVPVLLHDLLFNNPVLRSQLQSKLIRLTNIFFGLFDVFLILSCVYCSQRLQTPICRIFEKLQRIEGINRRPVVPGLHSLINIKLLLVLCHFGLQLCFFAYRFPNLTLYQLLGSIWKVSTVNMISAASLMIFCLLWMILQCNLGLQKRLEQLLNRRALPEQLNQIYCQQQELIQIISEFCRIFRDILLWYLMRTAFTSIQAGYYLIRIQFGRSNPHLSLRTAITIFLVAFQSLAEFYILNYISEAVENLIRNTTSILRSFVIQSQPVDRLKDWMMLQFSFQSTKIHIFGVDTINRSLVFNVMAQIVAHTLYMIQHDYETVM